MTKIISTVNSIKQIDDIANYVDGIVLGIKNLSTNFYNYFTVDEVLNIYDTLNKNIIVSLNKNMHNDDLNLLEEVLIKLNNKKIKIIFYDVAVLSIVKRLKINNDLIWGQEHLTTNYQTMDFYKQNGSKYTLLSSELTLDETLEIIDKNNNVIIQVFGYISIFTSKRNLVRNYLEYFKLNDSSKINYIFKEDNLYPIINDENGVSVYSSFIINAIKEVLLYKEKGAEYILLNSLNIKDEEYLKVLDMFNKVNKKNVVKYKKEIDNIFVTDQAFLYKESSYRVKYEK